MQSLAFTIRRLYSTKPPTGLPEAARIARTTSTPLAVRLRRRKKFGPTAVGTSDSTQGGLTPTELARYKRLRAQQKIKEIDGAPITATQWIERVNERRTRIRGFKTVKRGDKEELEVVGRRVYLPNIVIRLVRNHTPNGQPYNPYEATFRIPKSVTKTDLRSYLLAIYGVKTTYIRTDNYIAPEISRASPKTKPFKTYKRAVVGLVDPFYYPHRIEDLPAKEKEEREKMIEDNFQIKATRMMRKYELLRMTKGQAKGWHMKEPLATKRSHILRLVAERREQREGLVSAQVRQWQKMRRSGASFTNSHSSFSSSPPSSPNAYIDSSSPASSPGPDGCKVYNDDDDDDIPMTSVSTRDPFSASRHHWKPPSYEKKKRSCSITSPRTPKKPKAERSIQQTVSSPSVSPMQCTPTATYVSRTQEDLERDIWEEAGARMVDDGYGCVSLE
ncbi:hypothetical protein H0H93_010949 [Arthromyces matolae]|nr:hypothetical protein H0H93_010949 [Arthromyces matolae]